MNDSCVSTRKSFPDRYWPLYLGYSALLCGIFALMGFPRPHVDEPWFVGAAEHLARTGELYNPYIRNWMVVFTPDRYFAQFPLYPYILASWMRLAGIGVSSLLVFFFLTNFLCCVFSGWYLQRVRLPTKVLIFLPWLILSLGQTQGFRGDLPGLSAFWISALCLSYPRPFHFFLASLFASASVLLWPVLLGFICPLFAIHLWQLGREGKGLPFWHFASLLAGGLVSFLAFLFMIDFELKLFLHDFLLHASMRRLGDSVWETFLGLSWARYDHLFLFSAFLFCIFFVYWSFRTSIPLSLSSRFFVAAAIIGSILATVLYAVNTQLVFFFFWLALFVVASDFFINRAWKELGLMGILSSGLFIQLFYGMQSLLPFTPAPTQAIATALKKNPQAPVVFDEIAYRYLFDFNPPADALAWLCIRPAPYLGASLADKKPEQIWVISEIRVPGKGRDYGTLALVPPSP